MKLTRVLVGVLVTTQGLMGLSGSLTKLPGGLFSALWLLTCWLGIRDGNLLEKGTVVVFL